MKRILVILRLALSCIFLWAFVDKLFGLGFSTIPEKAWINGGSPTSGFLLNAPQGPLEGLFKSLAYIPAIDWIFMLGLAFVGLSLLLNRYIHLGSTVGIIMMVLMYLAVLPPENHPFLDDHIIYALVLSLFAFNKGK